MAGRIFFIIAGLMVLYLGYNIFQTYSAYHELDKIAGQHRTENPGADMVVYGFLDYSCVHCRNAHPVITEAAARDGRILFIPLLIATDKESREGALLTYAAQEQGKFKEIYRRLMQDYRAVNESTIKEISRSEGLDENKIIAYMQDPEIQKKLKRNIDLATRLGIKTTPSFLIGPNILYMPGDPELNTDQFVSMFASARKAR